MSQMRMPPNQSPLVLSAPLSRFTSRVGGGSALVVRRMKRQRFIIVGICLLRYKWPKG